MSFAVEFIDGPRRGEVVVLGGDVDGPDELPDGDVNGPDDLPNGLDVDGVHYAFTGDGKSIDKAKSPGPPPADFAYYATKDPVELFRWWKSLTRSARLALSANPGGPVPQECLAEVIKSGQFVSAAWWPSTQSGPDGFYLPDRVQEWIADHPLAE